MNTGVSRQELAHTLGLVRREVVGDDVDFFAARLIGHEVGEKRDELGRGMALGGLAQHLPGLVSNAAYSDSVGSRGDR